MGMGRPRFVGGAFKDSKRAGSCRDTAGRGWGCKLFPPPDDRTLKRTYRFANEHADVQRTHTE